ncbi:MAG: DNA translocase FtsK [Caldilinea sp. CFX5]|nr:DNA translocase FtsK [Caldilinea sp. CFX5]
MKRVRRQSEMPSRPWLADLRDNLPLEFIGLVLFLIGGGVLLTLLRGGANSTLGVPYPVMALGWTTPWFGLALLIIGAVFMLGERAGYWGIEAIVGVELLFLSGMMTAFLWHNEVVTWEARFDGLNGGLVGWALGSLLLAGLGRWPALALVWLLAGSGAYLTFRYTPLIYLAPLANNLITVPATLAPVTNLVKRGFTELTALLAALAVRPPPADTHPTARNYVAADRTYPQPRPRNPERATLVLPVSMSAPVAEPAMGEEAVAEPVAPSARSRAKTAPKQPKHNVAQAQAPAPQAKPPSKPATKLPAGLPGVDLLIADVGVYREVGAREMQMLIESTLEDFNVPVRVVHVESGPTVTQFGVEPLYLERAGQRRKVRVNNIVSLADDLALALAVPAVRIEAPVPGRPYVGIEVPNTEKVVVSMRGIVESKPFKEGGALPMALGRNTSGAPIVMDLARAPHMLIAGSTGSGKSVCVNAIIVSLLMRHGPESLRFVMVDPKMVELQGYNGIPHLLGKVIIEVDQVMGALTWLLLQMDDRYQLFKSVGVRNLDSYNALARQRSKGEDALQPLPFIVLIIDELADLMMTAADDIERQICRLAQMARATGIHLILATQRPSTDVVTGLIKANFPTRIAFAVTSQIDSRVILDTPGAERLLGRGDMLLMRPDVAKLQRVQGCLVTDPEINAVTEHWKARGTGEPPTVAPWAGLLDKEEDEDELVQDAIDLLRGMKNCSTSMLQRKLRIGYPKAARLMEQLAAKGIIGEDLGSGQGRVVLLKKEEGSEEEEVADE